MRYSIKLMGLGALAAATAGCSTGPAPDAITPGFGDATAHNAALQIIDPAPAHAERTPTHDAQVTIGAYGRYRTGQVKQPQPIGTAGFGSR